MQPPYRLAGLEVPERANHVIAEGVIGAQQGHESDRCAVAASAHQQLERLELHRLVPVGQGPEQGHLHPGSGSRAAARSAARRSGMLRLPASSRMRASSGG